MAACRHGLDRRWCAACADPRPPEMSSSEPPRVFAEFNSDCPSCGRDIHIYDPIVLVDGEWVCESCAA